MWIFPLVSTCVSAVFSAIVFLQYRERRKPYQLVWGIALGLFALASASELVASFAGWSPLLIRAYYLFGATLVVGYLALGTIYLTARPAAARAALVILLLLTAVALIGISTAPIDLSALDEGYRAMERPAALRATAVLLNALGTLIVVGGALWSAVVFWRKRAMPERAQANALIALGVLVVASGGTLTGQLGFGQSAISVANAVGVIFMFIGVLRADRSPSRQRSSTAAGSR